MIRPYTPTSEKHRVGEFDLIVKKYPNGPVSTHMDNMKVGDALEMKGPFTKYMYKPNMRGEIGMIAGGTVRFLHALHGGQVTHGRCVGHHANVASDSRNL